MSAPKIIFLDIDGVLNSEEWQSSKECQTASELDKDNRYFSPYCVENLNRITNLTDAKIVVSSTWRKSRSLSDLKMLFEKVGIDGEVIGKTDVLRFNNWNRSVFRGMEIFKWLEDNKGILTQKIHIYRSYVILDDDSDMLYWQRFNYYNIDPRCGLTTSKAYQIINYFKSRK